MENKEKGKSWRCFVVLWGIIAEKERLWRLRLFMGKFDLPQFSPRPPVHIQDDHTTKTNKLQQRLYEATKSPATLLSQHHSLQENHFETLAENLRNSLQHSRVQCGTPIPFGTTTSQETKSPETKSPLLQD